VFVGTIGVGWGSVPDIVDCGTLWAGSAQPPASASRQCALHIRRPQPSRIGVDLQPTVRQAGLGGATNVPPTPAVEINGRGAGLPGSATVGS
jgi:hypothetical protein